MPHKDPQAARAWHLNIEEMNMETTPLEAAKKLLINAAVGSCTCNTKSPELFWHMPNCRYVTIMTALENVEAGIEQAGSLPSS